MNPKKTHNLWRAGVVTVSLMLLMFLPALLVNSPISNNDVGDTIINNQNDTPLSLGSYDLINSPYLDNITPVVDWLEEDLINPATLPDNPDESSYPMFFGASNKAGDIITDTNHYYEDFVVMLDSILPLAFPDFSNHELIEYYNRLEEYNFKNSTEDGYYSSVNEDWTSNSSVKYLNGHAQLILSLIDWILNNEEGSSTAESLITNQWTSIENLFWDADNDGYIHSTIDNAKYTEDQFLMILASLYMNEAGVNSIDTITRAEDLLNYLMDESANYAFFDEIDNIFINAVEEDDFVTSSDDSRSLRTNAYAIWALVEWANQDSQYIDEAESIYQTLYDGLWNDTYSLFMTSLDNEEKIIDSEINLADNAVMLIALNKLFQATQDFYYINVSMQMYQGIQENFKDPVQGNYYTSIDTTVETTDQTKDLTTHAYLFRSYEILSEFANFTMSELTLNTSEFLIGEKASLNITMQYSLDFNFAAEDFSVPIEFADVLLVIRSPNNSIISKQSLNFNNDTEISYIFNTTDDMILGNYKISVRMNYTGLATEFQESSFEVISGIKIEELILSSSEIQAGAITELNFTVNNTRTNNITLDIQIYGDSIENQTFSNILFKSNKNTSLLYEIQTLVEADFEDSVIFIDFVNDSVEYLSINRTISLLSPVVVNRIIQDGFVYRNGKLEFQIDLENFADVNTPLKILVSGENIENVINTTSIEENSEASVLISTPLNQYVSLGLIEYNIRILRQNDNELIYEKDLETLVKRSLEITNIIIPETASHGEDIAIFCYIRNHLTRTQEITINVKINGNSRSFNETISPGANTVNIQLDKILNPYKVGINHYEIEIIDSNEDILYQKTFTVDNSVSIGSLLLGYFLPLAIPIAGIVITKHWATENKKRLG